MTQKSAKRNNEGGNAGCKEAWSAQVEFSHARSYKVEIPSGFKSRALHAPLQPAFPPSLLK